jgi:hypothetical protein
VYFDFLLSKNDRICLNILRLLAQDPAHTVNKQTFIDQFDLSSFRLNNLFENMNVDLATIPGPNPRYLDEAVKGMYHAHSVDTMAIQQLTLLYFKRSTKLQIFEYNFFYDTQQTVKEYEHQHFITSPVFYRINGQLKQDLQNHEFFDITGINQEHEFIVRLRLFQFYYTTYNGVDVPFTELDDLTKRVMATLNDYLVTQLLDTQQVKLGILIKIWIMRLRNQGAMTQSILSPTLRGETYQTLQERIQDILGEDISISNPEMDYFYSFLITQGFLANISVPYIEENFPDAVTIANDFISRFQQKPFLTEAADLSTTNLYADLLQINLQFTLFYVEPTTFIDASKISFFRNLYPTFDLAIREFLRHFRHTSAYHLSDRQVINLYFSYMFSLINAIPAEWVRDQVRVCVDFSEGTLYSHYVVRSLESFNHAHITVQPYVGADTDIYISDFHSRNITIPQVIWTDPPTAQDWTDLADLILERKETHLKELYPNYNWETNQFEGE